MKRVRRGLPAMTAIGSMSEGGTPRPFMLNTLGTTMVKFWKVATQKARDLDFGRKKSKQRIKIHHSPATGSAKRIVATSTSEREEGWYRTFTFALALQQTTAGHRSTKQMQHGVTEEQRQYQGSMEIPVAGVSTVKLRVLEHCI